MSTLGVFGVAPATSITYLYDTISDRIVAEGAGQLVRARMEQWNVVAPGRYCAATADDLIPAVLLEWQQFKAYNQYWVIGDES